MVRLPANLSFRFDDQTTSPFLAIQPIQSIMKDDTQSGIYILCYRNSSDGVMKITPFASFDKALDAVKHQLYDVWSYDLGTNEKAARECIAALKSEGRWFDEENDDFFRIDATTLGKEVEYSY